MEVIQIPANAQLLIDKANVINAKLNTLHNILNAAPKGNMGLTTQDAKTPEWRQAKQQWNLYFNQLRDTNQKLNKLRKPIGFEAINGKRVTIYKYK